jgi:DNA-binding CsgD family transcriptional regulator
MRFDDERWLALVDAFQASALASGSWVEALALLAKATGSRSGQLVGLGPPAAAPFNWVSGLGAEWAADFVASGGSDPAQNPIVRAAAQSAVLAVASSADFISPEERRRNAFLNFHTQRYDLPFICLTPLLKEGGMHVGLAVMRSSKQGEIEARERAVFAAVAPHVRSAVRTQIALEHQGAALVAGAMEALGLAVFVCDARRGVKALTPAAEALLQAGCVVCLRGGKLTAAHPGEVRTLGDALDAVASGVPGAGALPGPLVLRGLGDEPLRLEIAPFPRRDHGFGFAPRVLVIARGGAPQGSPHAVLRKAYGLTAAEGDVAARLAAGQAPEDIAALRRVSVGTVRAQIRALFGKMGVRRISELAAKVHRLG